MGVQIFYRQQGLCPTELKISEVRVPLYFHFLIILKVRIIAATKFDHAVVKKEPRHAERGIPITDDSLLTVNVPLPEQIFAGHLFVTSGKMILQIFVDGKIKLDTLLKTRQQQAIINVTKTPKW